MPDTPSTESESQPATLAQAAPPQSAPVRLRPAFAVWLRDLILSLAISAFIIVFIYQPVKVEGTSMMPSLADQERIFVNKFVYRLEPISTRGHCRVSLSARSLEELYQARDRHRRRPYPHRRRARCS